jgi:pyrimidine deaminase RibD-like protein
MTRSEKVFSERELMLRALELSMECVSEPGKNSPKVAAVVAKDGVVLGEAFRGELQAGEHAEYTLLERKLSGQSIAGATLYSTLEPCTSRNHPKIPCADRVVERKLAKVVIGILDRNPEIQGNGVWRLCDAGVGVSLFDVDIAEKIVEINRDFLRPFRENSKGEDSARKESLKYFGGRLGGAVTLSGDTDPGKSTSLLYFYNSFLGETLTSVNYAVFAEIVSLKSIATRIAMYSARALLQYSKNGKKVSDWYKLLSLPLRGNRVFYINDNWAEAKMIDFSHNSFDLNAQQSTLEPGHVVSGWMFFEAPPEVKAFEYKVEEIELTIKDTVGDVQIFRKVPFDGDSEGGMFVNPGSWVFPGKIVDLTKDQYTYCSLHDLREMIKGKR